MFLNPKSNSKPKLNTNLLKIMIQITFIELQRLVGLQFICELTLHMRIPTNGPSGNPGSSRRS